MVGVYSSAVNAADNASDKIKLGLSGYKTFQNIAQDVIDDFVPELLYYLASDMVETLISFLDEEACEE